MRGRVPQAFVHLAEQQQQQRPDRPAAAEVIDRRRQVFGRRDFDRPPDIRTACETCHPAEAVEYAGSTMEAKGVDCIDCHMGKASKSARANGPYEGDVWTHLFRINSNADYDMFNRDAGGNTVSARNALNLEFACFRCHADADKAAFADIGINGTPYHTLGK